MHKNLRKFMKYNRSVNSRFGKVAKQNTVFDIDFDMANNDRLEHAICQFKA